VAITLGKDCSISIDGNIASARNVSLSYSVRTIDVEEYGSREAAVYPVGVEATVSVEFNDAADLGSVYGMVTAGTPITVSGGAGAWSFLAVVTSISETDPIDGVATYTVEARLTRAGLRLRT
jgi:hypothetical protein